MVKIIMSAVAALSVSVASAFGTISEFPTEMTSLMDQTVDPCTDFFSYSCGTWYNENTVHANESTTNAVNAVITAAADKVIEKLMDAKLPKLTEFYNACVDTATLDTLGLAPIEDHLKAIRSANSTVEAIFRGATISKATGVPLFVKLNVVANVVDATRNILVAKGTKLPIHKNYYEDPTLWATVEQPYTAGAATDVVISFERLSAKQSMPTGRLLQEAVTSGELPLSKANAFYPLGLGLHLQGFGFDVREGCNTTKVLLDGISYLDFIEGFLHSLSVDDLKTIIEYKVLNFNAPFLSTPFVKAHSNFYDMVIQGLKESPPRATICRRQVDWSIGELLGTYYLKEVWTAKTAERVDSFVVALEAAFETGLDSAGWLDDTTRDNAKTKLSKFSHLLGGPKNPKTYPTLTFDPKAYIANLNKVSAFDTAFELAQIDTAKDKQDWVITAQTVNQYYDASVNTIVFSAATLQPPNYDANADPSVNYGGMGTKVGHEITHGFDNLGRDYDGDGNFRPWWTDTVKETFNEKTKCFVEQYGSMDVKSELTGALLGKLDGKLTLGETIADNGGLNAAYRAYRDYVDTVADATKYTKEAGEKMFWIAHAQLWCEKNTDEFLQLLRTDEHPPGRYRLIGAVQNSVDFANAFNCPVDSPMNPTKKCVLWE